MKDLIFSCDRLQRYKSENVVLTLPKGMNFTDYDYLAIYCTRFNHNFGFVQLKRDVSPDQMKPMDEATPKPCPQDHLEDEEDAEEEEEEDDNRRRRRRKSITVVRKAKPHSKDRYITAFH